MSNIAMTSRMVHTMTTLNSPKVLHAHGVRGSPKLTPIITNEPSAKFVAFESPGSETATPMLEPWPNWHEKKLRQMRTKRIHESLAFVFLAFSVSSLQDSRSTCATCTIAARAKGALFDCNDQQMVLWRKFTLRSVSYFIAAHMATRPWTEEPVSWWKQNDLDRAVSGDCSF